MRIPNGVIEGNELSGTKYSRNGFGRSCPSHFLVPELSRWPVKEREN